MQGNLPLYELKSVRLQSVKLLPYRVSTHSGPRAPEASFTPVQHFRDENYLPVIDQLMTCLEQVYRLTTLFSLDLHSSFVYMR